MSSRISSPHSETTDPPPIPLDLERVSRSHGSGIIPFGRSIVLVGLMGAGKTTIGRPLATRLGLPFVDADVEIERAAGCSIADVFRLYGEAAFRDGERRVIRRLLEGPPMVLATGGGAFMDSTTRALVRERAVSIWLRCPLPVLVRRVSGRTHRPLLNTTSPREVLENLMAIRHPVYAEADIIVDCGDNNVEHTTTRVMEALALSRRPLRLPVTLAHTSYDVVIGTNLISRAGALLAPVLPQKNVVIITDENVAPRYLHQLEAALAETGITSRSLRVPPGEQTKCLEMYQKLIDNILEHGIERRTSIIALGGGVVGDLAGFVAATTLRGLPFVQIPTTLLSQVDSSVGGKTGINTRWGKNLLGAFHQPLCVLADVSTLATLPRRELVAGYAEIVKSGLIGDEALFAWCEENGAAVLDQDPEALAMAVQQACAFKARVVAADEREQQKSNGRALLNLGHTFGHALEAELGYDGRLLHGEAVSIGLNLAFALSVRLGLCPRADMERVNRHLEALGMPAHIRDLPHTFRTQDLMAHMQRDKKMQDGRLSFVLAHGIGQAFTTRDVPATAVKEVLEADGSVA
ncbi:3-dehydroquinate synthase [Acetobacter ascendens]|uniref:Multifunctional fusion protein n=1 Tax=Acetobacter ascendens TaxID=481146 RepID=A0A1Y0UUQ1_9PROT|nr:3-dehydroquinate synthase [Acetobacter ascendens]ARW09525.1 Shikimate kinase [Acetobacter ascendens]